MPAIRSIKNLKIRGKIITSSLIIGIVPLVTASWLAVNLASSNATHILEDKLLTVAELRNEEMVQTLEGMGAVALAQANSVVTHQALIDFNAGINALDTEEGIDESGLTERFSYQKKNTVNVTPQSEMVWKEMDLKAQKLQSMYITTNPHPIGEKEKMISAGGESLYNEAHVKYHPTYKTILEDFALYDIFIVNKAGRIAYSVYKEVDYATNLFHGPYAQTGFGEVVRAALKETDGHKLITSDLGYYEPSYGATAIFGAVPIVIDGRTVGAFVVQMPYDKVTYIMSSNLGLGKTGESYIVGPDFLARTASRFEDRFKIFDKIETVAVKHALNGERGFVHDVNYEGVPTLSAYTPIEFFGRKWAMISEEYESEIAEPIWEMTKKIILLSSVLLGLVAAFAMWFGKSLSRPVQDITHAMNALAGGDLEADVVINSQDEIGDMAKAFEVFRQNALDKKAAEDAKLAEQARKEQLAADINERVVSVGDSIREIVSGNLNLSERTEAQAANVEETTSAVQEVASRINQSTEDANTALSIAEETKDVADEGSKVAENAIQTMHAMTASSEKIESIIGVIDEIAFQTNLLALNAAVEAARAGEQGRGFAVVASEVRSLAGRSSKAAQEIKELITESVSQVRDGSEEVNKTGERLNQIAERAAQTAETVSQIVGAMREQSLSINEINKAIGEVDSFTQQNAALVEEAASASRSVEEQTQIIVDLINQQ